MIDKPWKLEELDPGEKLDRRVLRRMRSSAKGRAAKGPGPLARWVGPRAKRSFAPMVADAAPWTASSDHDALYSSSADVSSSAATLVGFCPDHAVG